MGTSKGCVSVPHNYPPAGGLPDPQANILINNSGHACLMEFCLSRIVTDQSNSSSLISGGTIRWMSPELLDPDQFGFEDGRPTKESDCYALGMVVYEVLSGQAPFTPLKDHAAMRRIIEGERPERPRGARGACFTDELWGILELCWEHQPNDRPSLNIVLQCLEDTTRSSL